MLWERTSLSFWNVPWVSNDSVMGLALFIYKPVPFYGQHTQKYLVMFDLLLSGGLHVELDSLSHMRAHARTPTRTHTYAHTPRKLFFSTEINVYSIPNILLHETVCVVLSVPSMRFEVEVSVHQHVCVCVCLYMSVRKRVIDGGRKRAGEMNWGKTHACLRLEKRRKKNE